MSAKEEMIVEIESAKERVTEGITELQGVVAKIEETQTTVAAVMGSPDENFAHAQQVIEESMQTMLGITDTLDEAISAVGAAGQS